MREIGEGERGGKVGVREGGGGEEEKRRRRKMG